MSFSSDLLGFSNHCNQDPQMIPSSNYNGNDFISYSDINPISLTPFHNYTINPNSSKQYLDEQYPPNFLHLPSPLLHYELEFLENHDVFNFYSPQPMKGTDDSVTDFRGEESTSIEKRNSKDTKMKKVSTTTIAGGKKSGKKDRHSKINTAQGPRDRRMRLSLKVATEFFDLQDKLGYDKASKTIEWLLTQANAEIKKLASSLPNMSCSTVNNAAKSASSATNSECEVVSQINSIEPKESSIGMKKKGRLSSISRKNAFRGGPLVKESREKARARARERARMKLCDHHDQLSRLSSRSPFEASDSSSRHNNNPSMEVEKPSYHDQQENTTATTTHEDMVDNNSSVIMDKYWNFTGPSNFGYLPHTSTSNTTSIPQQNQSTDFQFFGKPWDSYNNVNLY
ncbi:hypothetical protein HS088_TW15G00111 [Tripterygium wilfordii]|uniref:Uncharacterized protein n=1 Tax=Tripterygium wilfordii TaxID=458696 RepID=A0A7J7CKQ1_TRIWF|nr:transcription factor DICHOTOMA [Tripterygium wilfordii]KAF5734619.1 hypothetical protein HS088_TW15G00111 [Tripterygium wilfordii]